MKNLILIIIILVSGSINAQEGGTFPLEIGTKWFIDHGDVGGNTHHFVIQIEKDTMLSDGFIYSELKSYDMEATLITTTYYRQSGNQVIEFPNKVILDYTWEDGDTADWSANVTIGMVPFPNGIYPVSNPNTEEIMVGSLAYGNWRCHFNREIGFQILRYYNHIYTREYKVVGYIVNGDTSGYVFEIGPGPQPIEPANGSSQTLPITLKWSTSINAYAYIIDVSQDSTFSYINYYKSTSAPDTSLTFTQLVDTNSVYYWRVRGYYPFIYYGSYSSVFSFLAKDVLDVEHEGIIVGYSLNQNYPNPFNPTTTIRFTISELRFTTLKVYDVLGNEIATLVNEEKLAGSYELEFLGKELPSGIYLYRLSVDNGYSETRKMVLLK